MKISLVVLLLTSVNQFSSGVAEYTCKCGWRNCRFWIPWRIYLGQEVMKNEYPMMAALMLEGRLHCGAAIITERHALTAAHCTINFTPANFTLRIGAHHVQDIRDVTAMEVRLEKVYNHDYSLPSYINDIALLVTQTIIPFYQLIGPVCLPNRRLDLDGQTGTVLGWGITEFGMVSSVLKKIDVTIISNKNCQGRLDLPDGGNTFCAITRRIDRVCKGDSGGPVLWKDPETGRETIVGLVSYGNSPLCPNYNVPGVYTDVTAYLDWINEKIEDSVPGLSPCIKAS